MSKITYEDKQAIQNDDSIANKNKVTADDMNEIKKVVNENADELDTIKTSVESFGTEITTLKENDIKQDEKIKYLEEEAIRLRQDIQASQLTGEAEGESIDLDDSSDARFLEFGLGGNHKQETREGYNLLDFNVEQDSKVTVNEDGTITINGTGGFSIKFKEFEFKKGVTYKTKATLVSGTYTSISPNHIGIMTPYGNNVWLVNDIFNTYTFLEDKVRSDMWVGENCVFNNATFKIYSYEGTDDKDFEQHGVSPSLYYPAEIKAVGDNENLFNKEEAIIINGYICDSSKVFVLNKSNANRTIVFKCKKNTTYTVSKKYGNRFNVFTYSELLQEENTYIIDNLIRGTNDESTEPASQTISTKDNEYLYIHIFDNINNFDLQGILDSIKIEKGSVKTPWSSHKQGCAEVNVVNKNFAKVDEDTDFSISNVSFKYKNGGLLLNGTSNSNISSVDGNFKKFLRFTLPKGSYVYSQKNSVNMNIFTYLLNYSDNTRYATTNGNSVKSAKFTLEKNTNVYIGIYSASNVIFDNIEIEFQVEQDTTATDCTEHKEQTPIMPVQQEMLQGDYFDFDREKEVHVMKKLVLKGTETIGRWTVIGNTGTEWRFAISAEGILRTSGPIEIANIICNKLKTTSAKNTYNKETGIAGETNSDVVIIYIEECKEMTVSEFNAYLKKQYDAGTPVIIYYKLATPVELDFTDEQKVAAKQIKQTLHTYKNVTHIYSDDEVSPIFNIKYAKDPNVKNDNLQKQIDGIKQLLSTTQTSALLLDNLQKDVESEVE